MKIYIFCCVILFVGLTNVFATRYGHGGDQILDAYNSARVINGIDVDISDYPYLVSLRWYDSHICGGSLISTSWVLSAAHCLFWDMDYLYEFNIQHSSTNRSADSPFITGIERVILHEAFTYFEPFNDVALIETMSQVYITSYAPLPAQFSDTLAGVPASVLGWGADETGYLPITLQRGDLYTFSNERCAELHVDGWEVFPSNICAGEEDGDTSPCGGDSGGPLLVYGTQVGVVSWGAFPCESAPAVFTQVSYYREWIRQRSGV